MSSEIRQRLINGALEVKVGGNLSAGIRKVYFKWIKFFNRLWHYGLNPEKNVVQLVKFCDDNSVDLPHQFGDQLSRIANKNGYDFTDKKNQLISLLATIIRFLMREVETTLPSSIHRLFNKGNVETVIEVTGQLSTAPRVHEHVRCLL